MNLEHRILDGIALKAGDLTDNVGWHQVALEGKWDGHWMGPFQITPQMLKEMEQHQQAKRIDTVVDYEHSSLWADEAPASGWITELQVREGSGGQAGLWARIAWTNPAAKRIGEREYRYLSPVIVWHTRDRKTRVLRGASLHSVALTNQPFLEELPDVRLNSLRAALQGGIATGEATMNEQLKALRAKMGLPEDASPEAVLESLGKLTAQNDGRGQIVTAVLSRLDLDAGATADQAVAKIVELQNPQATVPRAEFEALKADIAKRDANDLVEQALRAGKLTASDEMKTWARGYALKDPEGFRAWMAHQPAVVPMDQRQKPATPPPDAARSSLSDEDRKLGKKAGFSDEEMSKYNDPDYQSPL